MPEWVRFFFDPACPWCYQTSRWARRLQDLGELHLDWGLFSLDIANAERGGQDPAQGRSARSLRTCVAVREAVGPSAVGDLYAALGARHHEGGQALEDPDTVEAALGDAGLDLTLQHRAMAHERTWKAVELEHRALVERTGSFGVPTIVLDGEQGPAIFGPVISAVPDDADAVELWLHVSWLVRHASFAELKRDRLVPDLESVRAFRRRRQAEQAQRP
ncbi:MAG: DsbA family protein [Actinomycetota bacterium]|nr:DsbA family protein [Actinomycetota bacterium]